MVDGDDGDGAYGCCCHRWLLSRTILVGLRTWWLHAMLCVRWTVNCAETVSTASGRCVRHPQRSRIRFKLVGRCRRTKATGKCNDKCVCVIPFFVLSLSHLWSLWMAAHHKPNAAASAAKSKSESTAAITIFELKFNNFPSLIRYHHQPFRILRRAIIICA